MVWGRPAGISDLVEKVSKNEVKTLAIMPFRKMAEGDVPKLAAALASNTSLQELLMSGHRLDVASARALGEALANHGALKHLSVGDSSLGDEAACALLAASAPNTVIERLDLEDKGIGTKTLAALVPWLGASGTKNLAALVLSRNPLGSGPGAGDAFAAWKATGLGGLRHLELAGCSLGDRGAAQLADALLATPSGRLQLLDLSENGLTAAGAASLGAALRSCGSLRELRLSGNAVGDTGLRFVIEGLAQRPDAAGPLDLLLENCALGPEAGAALAVGLRAGLRLGRLVLTENGSLTPEALSAILESANERVACLDLSHCRGAISPAVLAQVPTVSGLERLCLFSCGLSATGLGSVVQGLMQNGAYPDLTELDVSVNNLDLAAITLLLQTLVDLTVAPKLATVIIGGNPGAVKDELLEETLQALREMRPDLDVAHRAATDHSQGPGGALSPGGSGSGADLEGSAAAS